MSDPVPVRFDLWPEGRLEEYGFHARSDYVERVWGSVVGPTAILCLREVVLLVEAAEGPVTLELGEFGERFGLPPKRSPYGPLARALTRLDHFGLAVALPGGYAVRAWLPPLGGRRLARAPAMVRELHESYVAARAPGAEAT